MSAGEDGGTSRMCQMFETVESDVHCRDRPIEGLLVAMGI